MNDMVDAVFGAPKHELLKLVQRPIDSDVVDVVDVVDGQAYVQHDFQETSSFRPCTCAHCNGLVSIVVLVAVLVVLIVVVLVVLIVVAVIVIVVVLVVVEVVVVLSVVVILVVVVVVVFCSSSIHK